MKSVMGSGDSPGSSLHVFGSAFPELLSSYVPYTSAYASQIILARQVSAWGS